MPQLPFVVAPTIRTRTVSATIDGQEAALEFPVYKALKGKEIIAIREHEYQFVIEAFLKGDTGTPVELPSIGAAPRVLSGYITAYATLPAQTDWLAAGSAFTWTDTGLAPAGLLPGIIGRGFLGNLPDLPTTTGGQQGKATVISVAGAYGVGGIGAELRQALGDALSISLEVPA